MTDNYTLTDGEVRGIAGRIAGAIISDARTLPGPVVWITGNSYMPPLRSISEAERVWNADSNDDGEQFASLAEEIESHLSKADVMLECPDYDNALFAVDLRRWQFREDIPADAEDLNDEWEPIADV